MSKAKGTRFLVRFVVLGAAAGTLAGYSAHATRPNGSALEDAAAAPAAQPLRTQISNTLAKADRLPRRIAAAPAAEGAGYALASAAVGSDVNRLYDTVFALARPFATIEPNLAAAPAAATSEPDDDPAIAAIPLPPARPKNLPAPPPSGLLDDAQIAGIKGRLRLTDEQVQYWPAVEAALRDIAKSQLRDARLPHARPGKVNIDVNSPEVQRLIWAAMPLLMRLREDQKREVRKLARVIGLDQVASQI